MKIGIFAYNFEHKKTQEGLLNLFLNGYKPVCIFAQDWKMLPYVNNGARVGLQGMKYSHPKIIAEKLNIEYINISHDDSKCSKIIKELNLDIGIILGSRILKKKVIDSFNIGVINMHPAMLPDNRGLDNIKWAILNNLPQGVTTHLISEKIDAGHIIDKKLVDVYLDDTLTEIMLRIQNKEQIMMIESLHKIEFVNYDSFPELSYEKYNLKITPELENLTLKKFDEYKKEYKSIVDNYNLYSI